MGLLGFVIRRLVLAIPTALLVLFLVFALLHIAPGDPARTMAGLRASEESVEATRVTLGLDRPVPEQFVRYLQRLANGDLGTSTANRVPVSEVILDRIVPTVWILVAGAVLAVMVSLALAIVAARRRDRWPDHLIRWFTVAGLAMPVFWVGLLLILLVALPTGWLPVGGFGVTPTERFRSVLLPGLTLALSLVPIQTRALRSSLLEISEQEVATAARALGIGERRVWRRHILRNAAPPAVSVLSVQAGSLVFAAVVIETTFGIPGIGQGLVDAVSRRDFPVIQGITLVSAAVVMTVHIAADITYALLDPRVQAR